jgi:hypothetical protein
MSATKDYELIAQMLDKAGIEYELIEDSSVSIVTEADVEITFAKSGKLKKIEHSTKAFTDFKDAGAALKGDNSDFNYGWGYNEEDGAEEDE